MSTREKKDTLEKQEKRRVFRVPSNRYLRHQHTKLGYAAILTFFIDSQAYGVELAKVKATLPSADIVKVVDLPEQITGIVKYKNSFVPVVNLRAYLKLNRIQTSSEAQVIVLKIDQQFVGLELESIADEIFTKDIKMLNTPANNFVIDSQLLLGVAKAKDREVALIDFEKLLAKNIVLSQAQAVSLNTALDLVVET